MMLSKVLTQLLAEFLGTFFFILTIPLTYHGVGLLSPLPIGMMLSALCFALRYISGAHFNPAITFAVFIIREISSVRFIAYILVQILAGLMAAIYLSLIREPAIYLMEMNSDILIIWRLAFWEFVYVFSLTCTVLHASHSEQKVNDFYGISIGMSFISAAFTSPAQFITFLNPAGIIGATLLDWFEGNPVDFRFFFVSLIAPMGGAFTGSIFYQILDTENHDRRRSPNHIRMVY
ncbi:unnamed protein product [Phytomonas sp. Hart1]|nr:unnamed protein product [Phytomonas sp. Hart1]|eukprot:CCW66425.1 unnamed protein product [Phytomonas sp. isolate Hart1]